jgi:hypothetical protein
MSYGKLGPQFKAMLNFLGFLWSLRGLTQNVEGNTNMGAEFQPNWDIIV